MFRGVTALLEKIDQQVEAIADEQDSAEEAAEELEGHRRMASNGGVHAVHQGSSTSTSTSSRQNIAFPPLPPPTVPARGATSVQMHRHSFAPPRTHAATDAATVTMGSQSNQSGRAGPSSSAAGGGGGGDGASSVTSSSSRPLKATPRQQEQAPHSGSASRLTALFSGAGAVPTVESLQVQCASLQQSVSTLEEALELAEASLAQKQSALEHLEVKHAATEEEKARCQREATYYKDIATTSRDQLTRCEGEVRVLKELEEETAKEFEAYKASSKCLIEEREAEVLELKRQQQQQQGGGTAPATETAPSWAVTKVAELEAAVAASRARQRDDDAEKLHLQNALAIADRERQRAQQQQQRLEQQVDALQLDVRALKETLEGEVLAHREATAQLKQTRHELQVAQAEAGESTLGSLGVNSAHLPRRRQQPQLQRRRSSAEGEEGADDDHKPAASASTGDDAALAHLEDALSEAQQRCQVLSFQLMERQTALDTSAREAAEWRSRYNALARRIGDEEVAAAAGYGVAGFAAGGLSFPKPPGAGGRAPHESDEVAVRVAGPGTGGAHSWSTGTGPTSSSSSASGTAELKRNPAMLRLARRGRAGRLAVELLAQLDDSLLQTAQYLRPRAVARLSAELYVCLLQVWVLVIFMSNLVMTASD